MAQPAVHPSAASLELSVQEVRSRLIPLARLADLTGRVTIITESGRRIAALVPADTARSRDEARADALAGRRADEVRADGLAGRGGDGVRADGLAGRGEPSRREDAPHLADHHHSGGTTDAGWADRTGDTDRRDLALGSDAEGRRAAAARGWEQRIDAVREQVRAQHRQRIRELEQALARAWELIDGTRPPGADRAADMLRAEHRDLLPRPTPPAGQRP